MSDGFLMLRRTEVTDTLLADMRALHLLTVIALRARYSAAPSVHGLTFGQAMIGDWEKIGMTQKEYRCAKQRLAAFGLASFKGKSRGTVATLLDQRVFNLGDDRKEAKQGEQKGDQKSDHFSEVKTEERASEGRAQGRTRGELGATNNKGIRKEPIIAPNGASELFEIAAQPIAPVSKVRRRDPLLDALAAIEASDLSNLTPSAWHSIRAALKEIRAVCPNVTPEQIQLRVRHYRQIYPSTGAQTARGLAKHWAKCEHAPTPPSPAPAPQRVYPKLDAR